MIKALANPVLTDRKTKKSTQTKPISEWAENEKWIDDDLAKSGLTRQDMVIEPFADEIYLNQTVSGYKILLVCERC